MTDRVILGDDERLARAEAQSSAKQAEFEAAWARVAESTTAMVRLVGPGKVHVHSQGRSFVLDRRDLPALRAVLALLEGGR